MKTTIEIADAILDEARRVATREKTTIRALVERGLRQVVREHRSRQTFRLKKATFRGKGLHPDVAGAGWERIRAITYEGRGGG